MDIQPPGQALPRSDTVATAVRPTTLLEQLQPGQTVLARVERLLADNEVELRIGNQVLRASTPVRLAAGQPLPLLVEKSEQGPLLKIAEQASQIETLARAWRSVLPRQLPVAQVIRQLVNTSRAPAADSGNAPAAGRLRQAVRQLVQQLPTPRQISQPDGLRRAIANSGVTLEAQLLKAATTGKPPELQHDIKANLLRVAQAGLQVETKLANQPGSTPPPLPAGATPGSGNRPVDTYTALLAAGSRTGAEGEPLPAGNRPLLPTLLPAAAPAAADTGGKLTTVIPQLLQRLLPVSLFGQPPRPVEPPQPAVTQQAGNSPLLANMVSELLGHLESGLARIQQHQLASQPGDEAIRHFLNLELPVFNGNDVETVGMQIEWADPGQQDNPNQHQWRVVLNFDFEQLGKTQVVVRARQGEIDTDFRSESELGREIFTAHRALLEEGFRQRGLAAGAFSFTTGEIENEPGNPHNDKLVETEA